MSSPLPRWPSVALLGACFAAAALVQAHAQSSLGIGTNEAMTPSTGLFGGLMAWVNVQQQGFYRALTGALKAMRDDGSHVWVLVGLSFAYGIFHAAGPGHGKAVISSYMVANEETLRRGVVLSFVSAFLQGLTAVILMGAVFLVLRGTSISMTRATWFLEVSSFALITLFGAWLLWKKAAPRLAGFVLGRGPAYALSAAAVETTMHVHGPDCGHAHAGRLVYARPGQADRVRGTSRAAIAVCETCGHSHAPDPALLRGRDFDWRAAWSAVAAVGLRPCSGALIVLTFSFLNGIWAGGLLSVFAMSLGTAITVSALATLAVLAKNWAVAMSGDGRLGNRVHAAIEVGGAAFVFLIGLTLLAASLRA